MQEFSSDKLMEFHDFRIIWKLVSSSKSDGTSIREYEADAPIRGRKYHKRVEDNALKCKIFLSVS